MGVVREYIAWITRTKNAGLNLLNLISKEVPKSAGKKGSTSRRKGAPKGKKPLVVSQKDGIIDSQQPPPASSSSSCPVSSATSFSTPTGYPSLCPPPPPPPSPYYPFAPSTFSPGAVGFSYPPYYDYSTYSLRFLGSPYCGESSTLYETQPTFSLKYLQGTRIRSCYGCGNPIRSDLSYIPPPPHDIVVSYKERRYYRDPASHELRLTQNEENTYYHMVRRCVLQKHPVFQSSMLKVPPAILSSLQDTHRTHIFEQFNLTV